MSLSACAELVQRGDPDRFLAAMAAPPKARETLFPLYAFNVEVARAPWVTEEPMIAEMRLQWWRDALEEIAGGTSPRRHEVVDELARLGPEVARLLDPLVAARRWDIFKEPFEDADHFSEYLDRTAGALTAAGALALGAAPDTARTLRPLGAAAGLARFLQAVPQLEARGRIPLVDGRPEAVAALAKTALRTVTGWRKTRRALGPAAPALNDLWLARPILAQAARNPGLVAQGALGVSEFRKRASLFLL